MYKMWTNDVLGKFPVMQHMRFGSIFAKNWIPSANPEDREYGKASLPETHEFPLQGNMKNETGVYGMVGRLPDDMNEMPSTFTKAPWVK